jgi:glycosyltransferase involved in cell wall biosynthesis
VLTVSRNALFATNRAAESDVPKGCSVIRVPCVDAQRHLSVFGFYPHWLAVPDRWASWSILGPRIAAQVCRRHGIGVIWSTYPIATAHRIAAEASQRTGLPWVADFRDPMIDDEFPSIPAQRKSFEFIEATTISNADRLVFVTRSANSLYQRKYPAVPHDRFAVIENGFDESVFESMPDFVPRKDSRRLVILHSGVVYPHERDPTALFDALTLLRNRGLASPDDFVLRFRAAVHEELLLGLARERGITDWIEVVGPVDYRSALQEMMQADALLIMQGRVCNEQIPAKLYEYMRAHRPIIGLADPIGATGSTLRELGVQFRAPLEDAEEIARSIHGALLAFRESTIEAVPLHVAARYSRRALTGHLAQLLDDVVAQRPSASSTHAD